MASHSQQSLIVLTGFMGSGKSSVGWALASLLNWGFVDLDYEIERAEGRKIRDIFAADGEPKFREVEAEALQRTLQNHARPFVLATGGGVYVQPHNAELLRQHNAFVVFLEASAETLLRRCCGEKGEPDASIRPLARDRDSFLRLYEERLPLYRTADLTVDADRRKPEAVAREIARHQHLTTDN